MKKKVLYGVFMALFAFAAIGTLQSCKDDVSDLKNQVTYDVATLKTQLSDMKTDLQSQITQNKTDIAKLRQDLAQYATIEYVDGLIGDKTKIPAGGLVEMIQGALTRVQGLEDALGPVDGSNPNTVYGRLKALEAAAAYVQGIQDAFANNAEFQDMADLLTKTQNLLSEFDQLKNTDFPALKSRVDDLETAMDELTGRLNKQVTGILIQGTDNPLFGNFSLPIGVKSNMLFNWYGKSEAIEDFEFPTADAEYGVDGLTIADAAFAALKPTTTDIKKGVYYGAGDGENIDLGKVYLTVNPVTADLSGSKYSIENSLGEKLPYEFKVDKSNDLLQFGYTSRAEEEIGNGFYEGEVLMPATAEAIEATAIHIEEGLKAAAKDALQDKSKRNAINLLKALYNQMNGQLDAYAARYDWNYKENGVDKSTAVLSQYDLAVATAHPLGFKFMADKSVNHKLPTFGYVDNFINRLVEKVNKKFSFKDQVITVKNKPVTIGDITVDKEYNSGVATGNVIATIEYVKVGNVKVDDVTSAAATPEKIMEAVNKAIRDEVMRALGATYNTTANKWDDEELEAEVNIKVDATLLQMTQEINKAIGEITGRAQNTVNNAANKVLKHSERLQQLVDLYNKVAGKINDVLANPNDYLQVAAFYTTATNVDILSADPNQPTPFDTTTGDAICLYLSTYTGELIAPCYKKYAAITAINGSTNGIADVNKGDLNKVLDGTQLRVNIPASNLKSGNKYEITYQAVDFRGATSTRKFYIQVI